MAITLKDNMKNSYPGQRRLSSLIKDPPVIISVVLGILVLLTPVYSIMNARWINPQPSLFITLLAACVAGVLLAASKLPGKLSFLLIIISGMFMIFWQTVLLFNTNPETPALRLWLQALASPPNETSIYFAAFLILVTWLLGTISLWYLVRNNNGWVCVICGTPMLLVNLANLPRENYSVLFFYFVAAIILLGTMNLLKPGLQILKRKDKPARRGMTYLLIAVLAITLFVSGTAGLMPLPYLDNIGFKLAGINSSIVEDNWFNIFYSIPSKWNIDRSKESEKLLFKDYLDNSNTICYIINAPESGYWSTRRYDEYNSWGWTITAGSASTFSAGETIDYPEIVTQDHIITYTVENRSKTDVLLAEHNVINADIPVRVSYFNTDLSRLSSDINTEIAVISSTVPLSPYESYGVNTAVSEVTPEQMANAGEEYPPWLASHYLQLPETLPQRVMALSRSLTADANTPYEKVMTIKAYLNRATYDPYSPPVPEDRDGVDYFLFESRRGVCTNFASAMVVMLRAASVPSRLVTGYLGGEPDKTSGKFIIRGLNTHAWVEVFFPGYGWITIEATPSGTPLDSEDAASPIGSELSYYGSDELPWWMLTPSPAAPGNEAGKTIPKTLPWPYIYTLLGLLAIFFVSYIARSFFLKWVHELNNVTTAAQAYERMCLLARRAKSPPYDYETPSEFGQRLAASLPSRKEDIGIITGLYMNTRYSPRRQIREIDQARMQTAWVRLNRDLIQYMLRLKKWIPLRYLLLRWLG